MNEVTGNMQQVESPLDRLVMRYRRADKFWLFWSSATMLVAVLVPSGLLGIVLFLAAREYLRWAEDA